MAIAISLRDIVKVYPNGVVANKKVNLDIESKTIHAIVGENGAGKSTLMKIIFGMEEPEEGKIYVKGKMVHFKTPMDAIKQGIGMVHQHLMLAEDLTVVENLTLGIEPRKFMIFLDKKEMRNLVQSYIEKYKIEVPLDKKVKELPIGVKQRVEILKALLRNVDILILDEPTAVLTPQETDVLFKSLKELKEQGQTIIFISHKLKEVKEIADKVTVMRDGKVIATDDASHLSEHDIARLMVGREVSFERIEESKHIGNIALKVENLNYINREKIHVLKNINFEVRSGEIVGIAGVEGNGQTELVEILTGLRKATSSAVYVLGQNIVDRSVREIREIGVAHIPEDRMKNGVAEKAKIKENLISDRYYKGNFSKRGILNYQFIDNYANELVKQFNILTPSIDSTVNALSGGNIQKVVVARELSSNPKVIIASQPVRGIDVGSEELVHNFIKNARDSGCAVLLVSADLDEILKLSSRILVIYNGEIVKSFDKVVGLNGVDLGPYMLGLKKGE
ncbi:ABC transporter ATP-binding protein [Caldisericum exile]|uniref:ABC transporter ATP-binding protein n=1 Tax=Caldisericum exile (strain DSM 21853 / NBRC 104410 / AZM16c01) TaxID=511051 RepID=A0A7U6GFN6_CALEA|nr:ABC transporter ATP-binding protein [Caldisericum exile]BAL81540.1 ABC transporter ATP-binding protein [Caldisericum exile AZM16c01]